MSFEYITAAFKIEGITGPQLSVLLNYCVRADEHGYSYPSRQRVADDMCLSPRAVQYAKQELIRLKLLVPKRRRTEQGRQTTDLVRVNLKLMQKMARSEREYPDNVMEEIALPDPDAGEHEMLPGEHVVLPPRSTSCSPGGAPDAPLESQQEAPFSTSSSRRDEDEDLQSPLRGYDAQIQEEPEDDGPPVEVTSVDLLRAKVLLEAVPWPGKRVPMGAAVRQKILIRMAELSAGGWTERDVAEYISGRIPDWKAVRRPADLVATLLTDSPTRLREAFQEAPEPREEGELAEARRDHERLARLLDQQQAMIADCSVCDEMGWFIPVGGGTMEWHGHGKMGLNVERNRAGRKLAQLEEAQAGQDEQVWEFAKG